VLQGDDCDFGGAVETEGKTDGADAAVDVELHLVEAVETFGVLLAHGWEDERAEEGEPDLAAVRVAGEHDVDERTARVGYDMVGEVGFVRHEENGAVGFSGNSQVEVRVAGSGVVDAAEPKAIAATFDGEILVDQNWSAMGSEGLGHQGGAEGDVVVAEYGVAERRGEGGEDLGAAVEGVSAGDEGEGAVGDEVAGKEDEVGGKDVDFLDDAFEEKRLGVLVEVDVAELDDAIAVEGSGQIVDDEGALDDVELMAGDLAGVESESGAGDAGTYKKISPGEA
jgi:hypothetical protein